MAIIQCPACGSRVSDKAATCPKCGEPIKKKTPLFVLVVFVLVLFYFAGSIFNDKSYETAPSTQTDKTTEPKKIDTKKWEDMLEYALLKNKINSRVQCKSKIQQNKNFILCTYYAFEYDKKALFFIDDEGLVAVNGTARQLAHYNEIRDYDYDKDGSINIPSIINSF